ncbi:hypothetical protein DPMN_141131 [Dreissena polymorpha]|uniref:Uncharacterized protein n=1 Tax=Dreissena polymorpha TaxID=45954 RepID=A0A9D4G930_DREPO|nr:hypothetical protein DPMN_141131 [Dreissena polymorpha]
MTTLSFLGSGPRLGDVRETEKCDPSEGHAKDELSYRKPWQGRFIVMLISKSDTLGHV